LAIAAIAVLASGTGASAQQGLILSGVGPINRSMGGASTAAPIDSAGALYWNPASIGGLERSEMEFGVELLNADSKLSSFIEAGSLGGGFPPIDLSGSTESHAGWFAIPSFGFVYKPECSPFTYGLGIYGIAGFGTNYRQDNGNPITSAPPPAGLGLGSLLSQYQVLQVAPSVAFQVTDHLSVGFAPTFDLAELSVDPAFFAAPDDANGDTFASLPSATHGRTTWGMGCQLGVYYTTDCCWNFGATIKSPQWFSDFQWNATDEIGMHRQVDFELDLPMILSFGASYTGCECWLFAADFRYYDYRNTDGFRTAGYDGNGAVTGLGWDSIFAVALGAQYQWSENISFRMGYTWNENPVPDSNASFNVVSPLIIQHTVYVGASYDITDACVLSLAYLHGFENSIEGPIVTAAGTIPGSSVKSSAYVDSLMFGLTVKF
jgi:long-chain fatty acid transport protein